MVAVGPWEPGDPWPTDTTGGAYSDAWGGYVKLWIRAALAPGRVFTLGPHANDRLNDGNVLGGAPPITAGRTGDDVPDELWVDLSCDALDVDISGGASSSSGIFTKPDASVCTVTLFDPRRKYDPLNGHSSYALGGRSRLMPGTPVDVFAEIVNGDDGSYTREWLFTGTADSWAHDWQPNALARRTVLVASGHSKWFVNMNRPALDPPVGDGDTTEQRIQRIVDEAGWLGEVEHGVGSVTLQATALDGNGWDLLNKTTDDEIGFVYFTNEGALRWVGRSTWFDLSAPPVVELGCGLHDVLVDASPSAIDLQIRNAVIAGRTDGAEHAAVTSEASIARFGRFDFKQTDLGLADEVQVGAWASEVLQLYAFPQVSLADVTARPNVDPRSWEVWAALLTLKLVSDLVRVAWAPPDDPASMPIDTLARVVGFHYTITHASWEVVLQLVDAQALAWSGAIFTLGPHANSRLDSGFVLG
jgi:hypothetical protein